MAVHAVTVARSLALLDRLLAVFGDRAFLVGGGLLGLVRDGGLIPDDNDSDLALHLRDWDESFLPRLAREGVTLRRVRRWGDPGKTGTVWPWAARYVGEHVRGLPYILKVKHRGWTGDVYVYAPGVGVHAARVFMERVGKALVYRSAAVLAETVPALLHGRPIRIPARAEDLLAHCYGDWRKRVPGRWDGSPGWEELARRRWIYRDTPVRVFTGGVFDGVHHGHVRFLERARALGDYLTVGVLRDDAVTKPGLAHSAEERREHVLSIGIADAVEIVGPLSREYLATARPNVLAYGPEWERPDAREWAATLGIGVVTLPRTPGVSSSQIRAAGARL